MIGTAVILDLLALIPVVGGFFGGIGGIVIFGIWFLMLGIPLIGPKQLTRWGLNLLGEVFTGGLWAGMTVGVILMIVLTRTEDKLGINVLDKVSPQGGAGKAVSTAAQRTERKVARRLANPERAAAAEARLARIREKSTGKNENLAKSKPEMRDFNYPNAA